MNARSIIQSLLDASDIRINGDRPWDIRVHNEDLYRRVLRQGTLGLGEAYMDGWWDCEAMDVMFCLALRARLDRGFLNTLPALLNKASYMLFNLQSAGRSSMVAKRHYDFDNALFEYMLGPTMNYSCGYWHVAQNLDDAQRAKMELICAKLQLKPGMSVLDIGCGWGGLATYMAEHCQVSVTGITVSEEQLAYAKAHSDGLDIHWLLQDYRSLTGHFDRLVSVGMFEHVGRKNYATFIAKARELLKDDGLFLLHTIGSNQRKTGVDPWIAKYIFPNGMLPSIRCIADAVSAKFIMEDWHNFGADYDKTLMAWEKRFEEGCSNGAFRCEERVRRMFRYYLLSCAGAVRARDIQLWQIMLSPEGVPGGYCCR